MDYQRACGCRMGRSCDQPVYRTVQMNNAHLKACGSSDKAVHDACPLSESTRTERAQAYNHSNCCGERNQGYPSLAIVTSPSQVWQKLYSPCDAMAHGTLFCELFKPWVGCKMGGRMR